MKKQKKDKKESFNFRRFVSLIASTKPKYWQLIVGLILGITSTIIGLVVPKVVQILINGFKKGIDVKLLIGILCLFVFEAILSAFSGILLGYFGEDVVKNIRNKLWNKLLHLKIKYFNNVKVGKMVSRLVNDSAQLKELLSNSFPYVLMALLQLIGAFVIMLLMDWKMTLVILAVIPLMLLVFRPIMKKAHIIGKARQDFLADFSGQAESTLSEIRLVKSSNAEEYEFKTVSNLVKRLYSLGLKEVNYDSVAFPLVSIIMSAIITGVLAYGASRVATGSMSLGTMFAFLMYLFQIISPVGTIGRFLTTVSKTSGSTERIIELLNESEENLLKGQTKVLSPQTLAMHNVSFKYDNNKEVLDDINFKARPNSVVAFVGPSGSGKSTIFNLIERYYKPTSGEITLGNTNIDSIPLKDWRTHIGYVSQDSPLMDGTVRLNLTYGLNKNYSDKELWRVLKLAYAEDFVKNMPKQLNTEVGERGIKLSGGQRQRLAIARAFLRNPNILMLDEATASLDAQSELMVQKALKNLMKNRTTLIIAHRLSSVVDANKIYFIKDGKVIGSGTHKELIQKIPLYREYVRMQFKQ